MAAMAVPWISDQKDFSYFDLQVTPMFPIKFQDNRPFVSGEEAKNRFSRWRQWRISWISRRNNVSYFYRQKGEKKVPGVLQSQATPRHRKRKQTKPNKRKSNKRTKSTKASFRFPKRGNSNSKRTEKQKNKISQGKVTPMLLTKIHVNLPSFQEKKRKKKKDFPDGGHGRHPGFPIWTILIIFIYKSPPWYLYSFKSVGLFVQGKKRKIDFQGSCHCMHLGIPIETILANSGLQVTLLLPTKFQVNWPFGSGEEAKTRFSRWPPWSWFPIGTIITLMLPPKFQVNWPSGSGEEPKYRFSRWSPQWPSWIIDRNHF